MTLAEYQQVVAGFEHINKAEWKLAIRSANIGGGGQLVIQLGFVGSTNGLHPSVPELIGRAVGELTDDILHKAQQIAHRDMQAAKKAALDEAKMTIKELDE